MSNPGFELLKQAFNNVSDKYDVKEFGNKIRKSAAAAGQTFIEKTKEEFPQESVETFVNDVYALIGSEDVANGLSIAAQSVSFEDMEEHMENLKASLSDDRVVEQLAKQLKELSSKVSLEELQDQLESKAADLPIPQQMALQMVITKLEGVYTQIENSSEEEIADMIKDGVESIPTDMVAQQIAVMAQQVTPERVSAAAQGITSGLPSGKSFASMAYGIGDAALVQFNRLATPDSSAPASVNDFVQDITSVVLNSKANDDAPTVRKKGKDGGFDFKI